MIGSIIPGENEVIIATYIIIFKNMECEYVENTASVTGEHPDFIGKGSGNKVTD